MKNKIKELRVSHHLSQEQLAEKAGISVRTLQRMEAGEDVSISTLNLVANALKVPVGDLFQDTKDSDKKETKLEAAKNLQFQMYQRHEEIIILKRFITVFILVLCFYLD